VLIGEGSQKKNCIEIIKKYDLNKNVKIIRHLPRNKITNIIMKSHLCIATTASNETYKYGISLNKFTEYMGCAKPIIVTARGHKNPVAQSRCGYCTSSNNPKELAKKIIKIYNLSLRQISQMGINGHKYSNDCFNYDKLSNLYYSDLKSLVLNK
jgi:glycosyltransferase involved in cell wall biosynthesis